MHCSVIGLPLNKACHMTTLTYTVTVSLAPLIVRAPTTKASCAQPATAKPPGLYCAEPRTGQRVETRLLRRPLPVCFPPAWMLLVRPAAGTVGHHEAFKYNYGLFHFANAAKCRTHKCRTTRTDVRPQAHIPASVQWHEWSSMVASSGQ